MTISNLSRRLSALAALFFVTSLLSCGREITGPGGARWSGSLALAPHFEAALPYVGVDVANVAELVPFTRVRVIVQRNGATILSRVVDFGIGTDSVAVGLTVPLTSNDGDTVQVFLRYINTAGDTVFSGGPIDIEVLPGTSANPTPVEMPVTHVGPGSQAVLIEVTPDSVLALSGQSVTLTVTAQDAGENSVPNAVFGFISRDPTKVVVPSIGAGSVNVVGARGTTYVIAQLVGGPMDSTKIVIDPRPTTLIIDSGNNQSTLQGSAFAQPLRVRVRASDNLGVANWPVNFAVSAGGGSIDTTLVMTDSAGFAQVIWTAGPSAAAGSVTASLPAPALNVVFNGTQQSTAPTSLTFATQPTSITAGDTLAPIQVQVRNGAGAVITSFNGTVGLSLTGGTAGASVVGDTLVEASAGVATFSGVTVNRGGTNYRLVASLGPMLNSLSNTFNVAAAPAAQRTLLSGGGQSAAASATLADSIVVRVTDQFGFPVAGITVNVGVTQGGGSVSPASGFSDADGRFATAWTLGTEGPQQITATAGALTPLAINATLFGGGPTVFFAGNDYTYVPAGQSRTLPVFLSSPSASPITVTLSSQFDSIASFDVDSMVFAPGITRLDVPVTAGVPGDVWMLFATSVGNDSVFVHVDSASLIFAALEWDLFTLGDTVRATILLSDPAPVGGVMVKVRSVHPLIAQVAASDGEGVPIPACLSFIYCGGDLRAEQPAQAPPGTSNLLGPLGDSTDVFIPQGHRVGNVAAVIVALGGDGGQSVLFEASAVGYIGGFGSIYVDSLYFQASAAINSTSTPFGIGQNHAIYIEYPGRAVVREHRLSLSSANPAIATVDTSAVIERYEPYTHPIGVYGHAVGSTYIRFGAPGAALDSFQVTVSTPQVDAQLDDPNPGQGESTYLRVYSAGPDADDHFPRVTPLNYTVTSRDTNVVKVPVAGGTIPAGERDHAVPVRMVGPGSAWLIVQADAHGSDSVFVSTVQEPLQFYQGLQQVGVGQYEELTIRLPTGFYLFGETKEATITSTNPSIVQVLTPTQAIGVEESFINVVYAGVSLGDDTIRVSVPGHPDFDVLVSVVPIELVISTPFFNAEPDSTELNVNVFVSDGSFAHPMMDTVVAILRSSDPSVIEVTDSIVTIAAGAELGNGKFRAVQPGVAHLTVEADGFAPADSFPITVVAYQLTSSVQSSVIGLRTREFASFNRNSSVSSILDYTITQSGPGAVSFVALADSFPVGSAGLQFSIVGVTPGEDTIVFSAAGHTSTTLVVTVDSIRLSLGDMESEVEGGYREEFFYGYLRLSESSLARRANEQMKFVVRSLDTLLARVDQDTVVFEPDDVYPSQFAVVKYLDFGTVNLVVEDPLGALAPDTIEVEIDPRELKGYTSRNEDELILGMGQKTFEYEVAVDRGYSSSDSLWVHLKASAPGVITIPDSVLIEPGAYDAEVRVIAGDSVGSVRVEASLPGYNPWYFDVIVTRTVVEPYFDDVFVGGQSVAEIYLNDALTLTSRPMAAPIPMRFTTVMPGIVNASIGNFLTDTSDYYTAVLGPIGVSVGETTVTVEDARVASFSQVASGTAEIDVREPKIELLREVFSVGLGLTSVSPTFAFNVDGVRDSIWVRVASSASRATPVVDSVLVIRNLFEAPESQAFSVSLNQVFSLVGDSLGVDTITVSADGLTSDYAIVTVEQGMLVLANEPAPTVVIGDSTLVTLSLRDAGAGMAMAAEVLQLIIDTDTNFVVTNGAATVSTLNIPASATTVSFWVKAINTGSTELVVTSPNFRTFKLRFTTRPLAG